MLLPGLQRAGRCSCCLVFSSWAASPQQRIVLPVKRPPAQFRMPAPSCVQLAKQAFGRQFIRCAAVKNWLVCMHISAFAVSSTLQYRPHVCIFWVCRERLLINLNSWKIEQQMAFAKGGKAEWEDSAGQSKETSGAAFLCGTPIDVSFNAHEHCVVKSTQPMVWFDCALQVELVTWRVPASRCPWW